MPSQQKECELCHKPFLILEKEREFLQKKNLPLPVQCFKCRQDQRLALRNERNLYRRKCAKCQQDMVSTYAPESPYIIYCQKCFWEYIG